MTASLEKKGEGKMEKKQKKGEGKMEKKEKKKGEGKMENGVGKEEKKALDILAGSDEDSDGGGEDLSKIQINEEYARRFEHNKRREALQRYEERKKQGLVAASDDDDEESSEEDDDEEEEDAIASRLVDRRVFEVIRRIRSGDPSILDKDAKVYSSSSEDEAGEEEEEPKQVKPKKEKPLYLKDVNARDLLEEGPQFAAQTSRSSKYERIAYDEQQKKGLEAFLEAEKKVISNDDDDDDLFMEKPKGGTGAGGEEEEDDEEEKQTKELAGEIFGNDEELDENEKFLKDFFLKRPYLESGKDNKSYLDDIQELSDEEELEEQEQYEITYNFRHEEAAASGEVVPDRVMGHSRIVEGSVRKKESSRKQQRKSKEERIARAMQEQAEELKHLKNLKKKEIAEKLERFRMIAGIDGDAACKLGADDLEEDFDPEDYDRKMQQMFDDSYYEADDVDPEFGSEEMDLDKPDFDKEDELLGLPKGWALDQSEEASTATGGKAAKGKISLKDKVELEKEMEEYYKLDYEDTIGDLKTRFKYKQVQPNNFGLDAYEILASDDRDLNQYVSMKKLAPYRETEWKVTHHKKLNKDSILGGQKKEGKKDKSGKKSRSEDGPSSSEHKDSILGGKKKEGKKDKGDKKSRSEEGPSSSEPKKDKMTNEQEETGGKKKSTRSGRRKRRHEELKMSTERQAAYGKTNPKRHKSH